jgi:hypothetical protein
MAIRMDVVSFKEKKGGGYFAIKVGSAVPGKKEGEYNIYLDAIPAPVEGQYRLSVVHQREKTQGTQAASGTPPERRDGMEDEIPF